MAQEVTRLFGPPCSRPARYSLIYGPWRTPFGIDGSSSRPRSVRRPRRSWAAGFARGARAQSSAAPLRELPLRDGATLITGAGSNVVVLRTAGAAAARRQRLARAGGELAKLVRGNSGLLTVELLVQHALAPRAHGRQRSVAPRRHEDRGARAHAALDEHRVLRRLGGPHVPAARRRSACRRETFYSSAPQPLVVDIGDEEIRVRPPARGAHGRRHLRLAQAAQRARRGRRRHGRRIPDHRLRDRRLDRRPLDATEKLLDISERRHADRARETGPRNRARICKLQLEMLTVVRERIEDLMREGSSIAEMLAAGVTARVRRSWGSQPRALRREHLSAACGGQGGSVTRCNRHCDPRVRCRGRRSPAPRCLAGCAEPPPETSRRGARAKCSTASARSATTTPRPPASCRSSP